MSPLRKPSSRVVLSTTVWCVLLVLVTIVMYESRQQSTDQTPVVLTYLLVVLGGCVSGGRPLGFGLAFAAFLLINYFFQRPFDTLTVGKPLDGMILAAFLATTLVTTDLVARARAEAEQARRRLEEIVRLSDEARHAEALREAARFKDVLVASVSHDLRTPLATITALAQDSADSGDANARVIVAESERLSRMVSDLLDMSRLNAGGFPVTLELNTAEDLIGAAVKQVAANPEAGRIRTDVDYSQPALIGMFDFVQSMRILANLLDNALRYSPGDSAVVLSAAPAGEWLALSVVDSGPGIPDGDRERVFEPFYRSAGISRGITGTGLGLSIARRLAEAQGGRVEYSVNSTGGSTFTLYLRAIGS